MIALNLKKKLRVFNCGCGKQIMTYNIHRKYCDDCRAEKKQQQMQEGKRRHKARTKKGDIPVDPAREARIENLRKAYEVKDAQLIAAGLKPGACSAYAALKVLGEI